ncbi:MAG: hypothetical protein EA349_13645 [Halomonadaceae bacterium]|nr:MAG: hypothetical protein EA349_13645 [Halomonadaceae bacterium]
MSKGFTTLETTRVLFEHPAVMFRLIERMDREETRYVLENDLVHSVLEYARDRKASDQERIRRAFSTDNLFRGGLVIDIDKVRGERRLVFQDALLGMMRACNTSLHQELTDARLRGFLVTLRDLRDQLPRTRFNDADPDYTELQDTLNEKVSQLIGMLRQNILRMQTISAELAQLSDDASRGDQAFTEFRQNLFERITTLYERHIKPTLVFLNRDARLADGANLFATLESIVAVLEYNHCQDAADQLFRSALSLNAMHRPIQTVAVEVDHFLRKTRRGMVQYNAMEQAFQSLRELLDETRTQDLRKTRLDGSAFVRQSGFLLGLKGHWRPKQYAFGQSASYYQLLHSELELRLSDQRRESEAPVLPSLEAGTRGQSMDVERIDTLFRWLDSLELRPTQDLVQTLNGRLEGFIEGYRFPDLLAAINRLSHKTLSHNPRPELQLVMTNRFRTLQGQGEEQYIYRKRRVERVPESAQTTQSETTDAD